MTSPLLTTREAADALNCSVYHIYALIRAGELAHVQIGRRCYRISRAALESFIAARSTNGADIHQTRAAIRRILDERTKDQAVNRVAGFVGKSAAGAGNSSGGAGGKTAVQKRIAALVGVGAAPNNP